MANGIITNLVASILSHVIDCLVFAYEKHTQELSSQVKDQQLSDPTTATWNISNAVESLKAARDVISSPAAIS